MKDNVKEMSQEIKFKIKNRDRDYTIITNKAPHLSRALFVSFHIFFLLKNGFFFGFSGIFTKSGKGIVLFPCLIA